MHIHSRFPVQGEQWISNSRRRKGNENTYLQAEKEISRSIVQADDHHRSITMKTIILASSLVSHIPIIEIMAHRRSTPNNLYPFLKVIRCLISKLGRDITLYSYPRIARSLNRDHTTIMYRIKKAEEYMHNDRKVTLLYEAIKDKANELHSSQTSS